MNELAKSMGASAQGHSTGWQRWLVQISIGAVLAWAVIVFWPSVTALAELWSSPERRTYEHGYLVAGIVAWLIYRRRSQLERAMGSPEPAWLVAAGGASVAWGLAFLSGLQTVHVLLWPAVAWLALTGWLGWKAGRLLAFPVAYLYFAMPLWDPLAPALQAMTVVANHFLTSLFGIPALIEGDLVHIPAGSFEVSGRCSGLNYFVVGLALGSLMGEINGDRLSRRVVLVVLIGVLAILSNWLRVFIVIAAGHLSDMQHYLVRVEHQNLGWALFALTLAGYFAVVRRLPAPIRAPVDRGGRQDEPSHSTTLRRGMVLIALATMALGPSLAWISRARELPRSLSITAPPLSAWQYAKADGSAWFPVFPGADGELRIEYLRGNDRVSVYIAGFLRQEQSREMVGHGTSLVGTGGGSFRGPMRKHLLVVGERTVPMTERESSDGRSRAVVWWVYRVGDREFASGLAAQLWYGLNSPWSQQMSTIVALRAECMPDCGQARQALKEFATGALPALLAAPTTGQ